MKICVVGLGPVGLVHGACMAAIGHQVHCIDNNQAKIKAIIAGEMPFYERGLDILVEKNREAGRLQFSTDLMSAVREADVIFICVGTPMDVDGRADMEQVMTAAAQIGKAINEYKVIVIKSTVPVGTATAVEKLLLQHKVKQENFDLVSNPEFLREGTGIYDTFNSDRIVIGSNSGAANHLMKELYRPLELSIFTTSNNSAEMIKYAANTFLATKISFINEIANICEKVGADVNEVAKGMGMDQRIGEKFLEAGLGFGGSCFPKDVNAIVRIAEANGYDFKLARQVLAVNQEQKVRPVQQLINYYGSLKGKQITILGLTFKPGTDDMREAPALDLIDALLAKGCKIKGYDPMIKKGHPAIPSAVELAADPYSAAKGSHGLILVTQWAEFENLQLQRLRELMAIPMFIDGRNLMNPQDMQELGFIYSGIGTASSYQDNIIYSQDMREIC